jgi:hypothetical protein
VTPSPLPPKNPVLNERNRKEKKESGNKFFWLDLGLKRLLRSMSLKIRPQLRTPDGRSTVQYVYKGRIIKRDIQVYCSLLQLERNFIGIILNIPPHPLPSFV